MSDDTTNFDPFDEGTPDEATELCALRQALSAPDRFSLLFVRCNIAPLRQRLVEKLLADLPGHRVQQIHFDKPITHLLDELRARLAHPLPDAVFVSGLENSLPEGERAFAAPLVLNLNAARNSFPKIVPRPLVLWVNEETLVAVFRGAPDFFSIRSGVYLFAASPEISNLGRAYSGLGEVRRAIEFYEQALAIARELGDERSEAALLSDLGDAYAQLNERQTAVEYHELSLSRFRKLEDEEGQAEQLRSLSQGYDRLGERHNAIARAEESLALLRRLESPDTEEVQNQLAAWRREAVEESRAEYQRAD